MRTRVALKVEGGKYVLIRAFVQESRSTPCGEVVRTDRLPEAAEVLPFDKVVRCLVCGDESFGSCKGCGRWGQP